MGASASINTIVSTINNRVENKFIQEANASAQAICKVSIGRKMFSEINGCTISVKNLCSASAEAQVDAVIDAAIEFYNDLTFEQKQEAPSWFTASFGMSTTVSTITNDFRQLIEQRCKSEALLNSEITVQDITVKNCSAPSADGIVTFEFINSGTAAGQCAIFALVDLQVSGSNKVAATQSQGLDWSTIIWPVVICVIALGVLYLLYYLRSYLIVSPKDKIKMELSKNSPGIIGLMAYADYIRSV